MQHYFIHSSNASCNSIFPIPSILCRDLENSLFSYIQQNKWALNLVFSLLSSFTLCPLFLIMCLYILSHYLIFSRLFRTWLFSLLLNYFLLKKHSIFLGFRVMVEIAHKNIGQTKKQKMNIRLKEECSNPNHFWWILFNTLSSQDFHSELLQPEQWTTPSTCCPLQFRENENCTN